MGTFEASVPWIRIFLLGALLTSPAATATPTAAGTATATAPSSGWIAFEVPFTGDDDRDGWTVIELGLDAAGPFDLGTRKIPGPPEWRADSYRGLSADTDYYLRVTYVDPDGVSGANPQIVGPVHTLASAVDAVTLGTATAEARDTEIFVSLPIADDANGNSYGTVEVATDPGGPWTERCGSPSDNRLLHHPKRCRLRSLTPGTDYWVRIDLSDPDGIVGADPQILGPITYTGRENLAAGRPITADPGWGCCPNPAQLVDGRIQYRFWPYGFAWTGGTTGYGGGPAGWKQATIDLGAATTFDRVEVWLHGGNSPPTTWRVETSDDGAAWSEVYSTTEPQCRGASEQIEGTSWSHPACSQGALFAPATARYVRYWFDDRTLFGGLHGWAAELEVFAPAPDPATSAAGTATATAPSSGWIAFEVPFTGDDDRDGWTVIELGLDAAGPFDLGTRKIPGPPEWRADSYRGLSADTDYYLRVTYVDPDGVSGANPQIVGPVHTLASAVDAVTLGTATAEARDTEIFVSLPIADDANGNSYGTVEVATDPGGPWTERCGSPSDNRLLHHPKRCRLRSLTPGTDYWVRIDLSDPDGIVGADPQILGPITYTGRENLAAGRPITADPGWGCCPNPAQLVDGRIQYRFWPYGFAWTGGTTGYGGGPAGWKQATIDLGAATTFDRVEVWLHGGNSPPTTWRVETSDDGAAWSEVYSTTEPQCRGASEQIEGTSWSHPACSQGALFAPATARYVRYWFDDRTLFGGLHGWAAELEVFSEPAGDLTPPTDPTSVASTTHVPGAWSSLRETTVEWSGATDAGGSGLAGYSVLFDTSPSTLPDETVDVSHSADPHSTTSPLLADGQEHQFHLRTCDLAGNCTSTVHLGPFWIDATPPSDPGGVQSTSHVAGVPSSLDAVTMSWTAGADAASGLDGYAWAFDVSSTPACDEVKDLEETAVGVIGPPLADGAWWFHICAVDHAGNWGATATTGPYVIDTLPPRDPTTVESTSHTLSTWSNDNGITVRWSGAVDLGGGSGVAGYSVQFDTAPVSLPDSTIDVHHAADPHSTTSGPLTDGASHWFHLRTCDHAGNCTATVHLGPFWIDATDPGDPTGVASTSHVSGTPSNVTVIDMTWTAAVDNLSDVDGYAYEFAASAAAVCDQGKDLEETATGVASAALGDGDWWFHVCTVDHAGNWTATATAGPFSIDATPPLITRVQSSQRTHSGDMAGSTYVSMTQLMATFSEPVQDPPGDSAPQDVTNPTSYLLVATGADELFQTADCAGVQGDDAAASVDAVSYDAAIKEATLWVNGGVPLAAGKWRLLVCNVIRDVAGNRLDGGDFVRDCEITLTNHLRNPSFDTDLASWVLSSPTGVGVDHHPEDIDAVPTSGSARVASSAEPTGEASALSQCLPLEEGTSYALGGETRLTSTIANLPRVRALADVYASLDCTTGLLHSPLSGTVAGDTGGAWEGFEAVFDAASGARSAQVIFVVQDGASAAFTVHFDNLYLRASVGLFADGFESGDSTAWSSSVP